MKTVVYQSYRTHNVPDWIEKCMRSVRAWSQLHGYEYKFIDDRIFEYVPTVYREKARNSILLMTDFARLELAREFLDDGFERTIWVDADVIIFDPEQFVFDESMEYAFCREVWMQPAKVFGVSLPVVRPSVKVNNAVTMFTKRNSMLDFYRSSCHALVNTMPRTFDPGYASTTFLTWMHKRLPLPLLVHVGLFSPLVLRDVRNNGGRFLRQYMKAFGHHIYAANLCSTYNHGRHMGIEMNDAMYESVIERLLETKGDVLNRHLPS